VIASNALRKTLSLWIDDRRKRAIKSTLAQAKLRAVRALRSYNGRQLQDRLRAIGIAETDTLLVHSNFKPDSGFTGTPADLASAFVEAVGQKGNLLMVSIPFRGSAYDHLALGKVFDARKTLSMMGLVTEMFRRRTGTLRSLHPTHPVLACGRDAEWLVADHDTCLFPCGPGSPFEKFRKLNGKILFFDVGFGAITFFHYVEDLLKAQLPFQVYADRLFDVKVVDAQAEKRTVATYAFNKDIPRDPDRLEAEMSRQGKIRKGRIGNSRFLLVDAEDVLSCMSAMVAAGNYPYHLEQARA
jgi:aminoglycoside 3-N-acetyltransferase